MFSRRLLILLLAAATVTTEQNITIPLNSTSTFNNSTVLNGTEYANATTTTAEPNNTAALPTTTTLEPVLISKNLTEKTSNDTKIVPSSVINLKNKFNVLLQSSIGLDGNCTQTADCKVDNSLCIDTKCKCGEMYVESVNKMVCLRVATKFGEYCTEDLQCTQGIDIALGNVSCKNGKCDCSGITKYVGGKCVMSSIVGEECKEDAHCKVLSSTCEQGVCACSMGTLPHPNGTMCIPAMHELGGNCMIDAQCQEPMGEGSKCLNTKCVCASKKHFNGTHCVSDLGLGSACTVDEDCAVSQQTEKDSRRICKKNVCKCTKGYSKYLDEDFCRASAGTTLSKGTLVIATAILLTISSILN